MAINMPKLKNIYNHGYNGVNISKYIKYIKRTAVNV